MSDTHNNIPAQPVYFMPPQSQNSNIFGGGK